MQYIDAAPAVLHLGYNLPDTLEVCDVGLKSDCCASFILNDLARALTSISTPLNARDLRTLSAVENG
jgi:hypothetical protein